ncbi:MAG TPA: MogA/MoaB family molybdenum cofactor biosynthesis protein [Halanaerobiales bacterium]|nr:MogA/MoaB family molybdenum cofactor biosynthesis protein [Halanaerobiales bacterium]
MIKTAVVTISDKGSQGKRKDKSGPVIIEMLKEFEAEKSYYNIIPDELEEIKEELIKLSNKESIDLILTTGGTGFAPRDVTPEATQAIMEKDAPGIADLMRMDTISITKKAALSRAVSVIRNDTLIINLPGSPKAVRECLQAVKDIIPHGIEILKGEVTEHN